MWSDYVLYRRGYGIEGPDSNHVLAADHDYRIVDRRV